MAGRERQARRGLWLVGVVGGLGFLSWIAFGYVALRSRTRAALAGAVLSFAVAVVMVTAAVIDHKEHPAKHGALGGVILGSWLVLAVVAVFVQLDYRRWSRGAPPRLDQPSTLAARSMPPESVEALRLPPMTLNPPVKAWIWVGRRLGIPAVTIVAVFFGSGALSGNSAEVVGALGTLVFLAVLIPSELALIYAAQRRRRERMLADTPGALFAAVGYAYRPRTVGDTGLPRLAGRWAGRLVLDTRGITFTPRPSPTSPGSSTIAWGSMSSLTLTPVSNSIARIEVLVAGQILGWRTTGPEEVRRALLHLQQVVVARDNAPL